MKNHPANKFEILRISPENTNSVLVSSGDACVIFDPWGRGADWVRVLETRGLKLRAVYATHGHPDHISAAPELATQYNVPCCMCRADWGLIGWGNELLEYFGLPPIDTAFANPTDLPAGHIDVLPGVNMDVIAAPGHSAGGMMFYFPEFQILLTGDTLFRDGIGRCDFPTGDADALCASISHLYRMNLPDETYVVHGHGPDSTIAILKESNQYFKECA